MTAAGNQTEYSHKNYKPFLLSGNMTLWRQSIRLTDSTVRGVKTEAVITGIITHFQHVYVSLTLS